MRPCLQVHNKTKLKCIGQSKQSERGEPDHGDPAEPDGVLHRHTQDPARRPHRAVYGR